MPMKKSFRATRYTRKSFFVDAKAIRRARKALGVGTDAGDAHDWDRNKRRDFQNDALIALTAKGHVLFV